MMRFAVNHLKRRARPAALSSQPDNSGFTIVELLIVLAIASLILLLVFEALPALERNSRNNQRRQDVQTVLAAVSHWELNNSGNVPNPPGDAFLQYSKLYYYDPTTGVSVSTLTPGETAPASPSNLDKVYVYNYQRCSTGGGSTAQGAGYNDVVALYYIETGTTGTSEQCQQL